MKSKKVAKEPVNETDKVDAFMAALTHPFKTEIEALRAIIKRANPKLGERLKWNAPSFFYKRDMASFNLHAKDRVQLVVVFHDGRMIGDRHGLLEGDYKTGGWRVLPTRRTRRPKNPRSKKW